MADVRRNVARSNGSVFFRKILWALVLLIILGGWLAANGWLLKHSGGAVQLRVVNDLYHFNTTYLPLALLLGGALLLLPYFLSKKAGGRRSDVRGRRSGVRGQKKTEVGGPMSEVGGQESDLTQNGVSFSGSVFPRSGKKQQNPFASFAPSRFKYLLCSIGFFLAAGTLFGLRLYATGLEPFRLVVQHVSMPSEKVSRPLRIVHVSDIQSAAIGEYEDKVFEEIRALKPDLVLFTGDYLQPIKPATVATELPKLLSLISELQPALGFYSVYGETDALLKDIPPNELAPLHVLNTEKVYLKNGPDTLILFGMPLTTSMDPKKAAVDVLDAFMEDPKDTFKIVLGHHPTYAKSVGNLPVDLCLAGHTHGGQICAPFYGPLFINCDVPRQWSKGFHHLRRPHLNVSAGVGCTHSDDMPSIRFLCRPEMTVIDVVPGEGGGRRSEAGARGRTREDDLDDSDEWLRHG